MKKFKLLTIILFTGVILIGCQVKEKKIKIEQYSINQFMNNTNIFGSSFSPDESKILFNCDKSGVYNAYEINLNGGDPVQLTNRTEATYAISYFPNDERLLLSSDNGGNEIYHIYVREIDGTIHDITPFEKARASFYGWSKDKRSFFIQTNKRDSRYMDLYEIDIETFKFDLIYKNTEGFSIGAISDDKSIIALTKTITWNYNRLFIYNRNNNKIEKIKDIEETINYPVEFSKDNKYLYYLSNIDSEFTYYARLNLETKASETIYKDQWDVSYAYHSRNENYRIIVINQDAQTIVKVFDVATGKEIQFPKLKKANIKSVYFSDSESIMSFYGSSSKTPQDLYTYKLGNTQAKKLTNTLNPEINPDFLANSEVIRYKSFDGLEIPAILYKPINASSKNKVPAIVLVHGGPGGQSRVDYDPNIQYLVNHGYAIIAVNNRGSSGYGRTFYSLDDRKHGDHDLKDCIFAKEFLIKTGWVDANKIGIMGGSYGGYMTTAALAFTPDEFAVGVNLFGVTNWLRTLKSTPSWWEANKNALYKEMGNPITDSVYLKEISPLFHAEKITKPLMVLQGANDPRVLRVESDEIVEAVKANNVPVEYVIFDDEGHGFVKRENKIVAYKKILEFLDKYLK